MLANSGVDAPGVPDYIFVIILYAILGKCKAEYKEMGRKKGRARLGLFSSLVFNR